MNDAEMTNAAERAKRENLVLFGVFAAIAALLLLLAGLYRCRHSYSQHKWNTDQAHRYRIVGDLLDRHLLDGLTEAEVIALLGEEDSGERTSFKISKRYFPPETTLVYWLGVDFMDDNWLVVSLDDGVVTDVCTDLS